MSLEEELEHLSDQNAQLHGRVQELLHENEQLKKQLIILNSPAHGK
jgi:predicted RNase H-like nuclease (RuvC/YqgF family)